MRRSALFCLTALAIGMIGCYQQQSAPQQPYYPQPPPQQQQPPPQWGGYQQPPPAWPQAPWWTQNLPTAPLPFDNAQRCVDAINNYRASIRLPPLARWVWSESCAGGQAQNGAQTGQPHGAFGRCSERAQNVCPGWAGPADRMIQPCIQSEWLEGPGYDYMTHGHYLNMTNPAYTKVACGFFTAPNGQVWAVQDFQ